MKLLVITQKVDNDDGIMGFFHGWLLRLASLVDELHVITLYLGAVDLPDNPDYAKVAEAMGAKGYTVDDYRDVQDVVRDAMASGEPCVINAIVEGGENVLAAPFRRDAMAVPTRHLDKYAHLDLN